MATYYAVLGCEPNASYEELKKAYQELVLKHHPDKQISDDTNEFYRIDEAWKTVRDPEIRKLYDSQLLQSRLNEQPLVYAFLDIKDLSYDDKNSCYNYSCRCSGQYFILKSDLKVGKSYIECDECSLVILVNKDLETI